MCTMCHQRGHSSFRETDINFANQKTKHLYSKQAILGYSQLLAGYPWPDGVKETQKSAETMCFTVTNVWQCLFPCLFPSNLVF